MLTVERYKTQILCYVVVKTTTRQVSMQLIPTFRNPYGHTSTWREEPIWTYQYLQRGTHMDIQYLERGMQTSMENDNPKLDNNFNRDPASTTFKHRF